jgi:hypothetical protein
VLRQAAQSVDAVAESFGLTAGEVRLLLSARRGEGLLISVTHRVGFQAVAPKNEHRLCIVGLEFAASQGECVKELRDVRAVVRGSFDEVMDALGVLSRWSRDKPC